MERIVIPPRRRFRGNPYRPLAVVLVVALLLIAAYFSPQAPPEGAPSSPLPEGTHRVVRVVDGDTLIIAPNHRLRLIGVNAPESVKPESPVEPFGPEASEFTRQFVSGGQVRLTFDAEPQDRFGRMLAYVWVGDRCLNEELVRNGLAHYEAHFRYSDDMKRRFRQAQREAQREHLGIWSQERVGAPGAR